jgi:hypothetical protein
MTGVSGTIVVPIWRQPARTASTWLGVFCDAALKWHFTTAIDDVYDEKNSASRDATSTQQIVHQVRNQIGGGGMSSAFSAAANSRSLRRETPRHSQAQSIIARIAHPVHGRR